MKTEQTIKIKGFADLSKLKTNDAVGYGNNGKPILSQEEALKMLDKGRAPAAKGYKGNKKGVSYKATHQEMDFQAVQKLCKEADYLGAVAIPKLQKVANELREATKVSQGEVIRREKQMSAVTLPEQFTGKEGNVLSLASVINRLGQPARDHAKIVAAAVLTVEGLSNLDCFVAKAKFTKEIAKLRASGKVASAAQKSRGEDLIAACNAEKVKAQATLNEAYTERDRISAEIELLSAAATQAYNDYTKAFKDANGQSPEQVSAALGYARKGASAHVESIALLEQTITDLRSGQRAIEKAIKEDDLAALLGLDTEPETPADTTPPIAHETDNIELAKAVAADPTRVLDMIDDYFLKEEDDKFVAKPGLEEFVSEKGSIFVTGEHAELILAEYNALIATAEPQLPNAKKERTKVPSKGTKVANAKPRKSKSA